MVVQGTQADFKNELLYKSFGINYNQLPARFRKVRVKVRFAAHVFVTARLTHFCTPAGLGGVASALHRQGRCTSEDTHGTDNFA